MYKLSLAMKLIKESFKKGLLRVAQSEDEEIYVVGKEWLMWFDTDAIPREIKGGLISVCGDLPDPGSAYTAYPDGSHQMEIFLEDILPITSPELTKDYHPTRFLYARAQGNGIVLWSRETKEMMIIDSRAISLIMEDEQEVVNGPFRADDRICWESENSMFCIQSWDRGEKDDETEKFLKALEEGWL